MNWGMQNRLNRIINPATKKCVMLAVDHGYFMGPTTGLQNLGATVEPLLPHADALMITRGGLRNWVKPDIDKPIILRMSGGPSVLKELSDETITCAIDDAIRINASAITCQVAIGAEYESQTVENLNELINEGEEYGIPVLAVTAVGKDMVRDARYFGLSSRICVEQGAHMVKTYYCDNFREVVEACGNVPIVIAGGKKIPELEALQMASNAIKDGAVGVDMGRNIFQSEKPVEMIQAVRSVVVDGATPEDAEKQFLK